jgi:hypothetical protein
MLTCRSGLRNLLSSWIGNGFIVSFIIAVSDASTLLYRQLSKANSPLVGRSCTPCRISV